MLRSMALQFVVLYILLQASTAITQQCIPVCPSDLPAKLVMRPGQSLMLCLDFQYHQLAGDNNVALFDISKQFCSTSDQFLDSQSSISNIKCNVSRLSIKSPKCHYMTAVVTCNWLEDKLPMVPSDEEANNQNGDESSNSKRRRKKAIMGDSGSVSMHESLELGLAIQLSSTNIMLTGSQLCNLLVNITWHNSEPMDEYNQCSQLNDTNFDICLKMCTDDVQTNGDICDTLVGLVLAGENLEPHDSEVILSILWSLSNTSDVTSLYRAVKIIDLLVDALESSNHTLDQNGGMDLAPLLDSILDRPSTWARLQEQGITASPMSSTLLESIEQLLSLAGSEVIDKPVLFNGTNIITRIERVKPQTIRRGSYKYYFPQVNSNEQKDFILIPEQLLCTGTNSGNGDCASVATALVRGLPLYLDQVSNSQDSLFVNTPLLILTVSNEASAHFPIGQYPVELHLNPLSTSGISVMDHSCMFWDFNNSGWSSVGITTRVAPDGTYICTATHLTSFAVLVGLIAPSNLNETESAEEKALSITTYVGSSISFVCLVVSLLILIGCGKKLNKGVLLYVHINFCLALCLALLVFIAGIESAVSITVLCKVVAATLHYLFLCAFCWMLAEGIILYVLVVKVFGNLPTKWYYFALLGWGLPVPIVAVSIAVQHDFYGTDRYCWLSIEDGVIWAFVGPMLLIVCVNGILLVLTICNLLHSRKYGGAETRVGVTQLVKSAVKAILILLPLLGLTWVLGIFALSTETAVFAWLFTICNSLQGFFFFMLHIVRNEKVYKMIRSVICCVTTIKVQRPIDNGKTTLDTKSSSYSNDRIDLPYAEVNAEIDQTRRCYIIENRLCQSYSQTLTKYSSSRAELSSSV